MPTRATLQRVSIRHQPEYLPSRHHQPGSHRHPGGRVSIRHQPEYLPSQSGIPSTHPRSSAWRMFQSGISLSICLHNHGYHLTLCDTASNVSIRHQPEYLPSLQNRWEKYTTPAVRYVFQSGISLSICLHRPVFLRGQSQWLSFNQASA